MPDMWSNLCPTRQPTGAYEDAQRRNSVSTLPPIVWPNVSPAPTYADSARHVQRGGGQSYQQEVVTTALQLLFVDVRGSRRLWCRKSLTWWMVYQPLLPRCPLPRPPLRRLTRPAAMLYEVCEWVRVRRNTSPNYTLRSWKSFFYVRNE